jgi:ketosteroid isomerase-like protein
MENLARPFAASTDPISILAARGNGANARAVIMEISDAFCKNDYPRMAALYHDDIDWLFHGPKSIFPEAGHRRGKVEVFKTLAALNTLYRFERYVVEHLSAEGDWAAGVADVKLVQRTTGRVIQCKIASFHRVGGGQVVEYRGFTDSFDAAEQVIGHEFPL